MQGVPFQSIPCGDFPGSKYQMISYMIPQNSCMIQLGFCLILKLDSLYFNN